MKALLFFVVLLLALAAVSSKKIRFRNCASEKQHGQTLFVDVTPCDGDPCVIKRGSNETVTISAIPHEVVTSAKINLYVIFWVVRKRLPIPNPNVCEGYGLTCPLKSGVPVKLEFTQEVSEDIPPGTYTLEADVKDQNDNSIICENFDLTIA